MQSMSFVSMLSGLSNKRVNCDAHYASVKYLNHPFYTFMKRYL